MNRAHLCRTLIIGLSACAPAALAAGPRQLTLPEAVQLALHQNRALKIARLKVTESEQKKAEAKSSYFPELKNESTFFHTTAFQSIGIPAGAFAMASAGCRAPMLPFGC